MALNPPADSEALVTLQVDGSVAEIMNLTLPLDPAQIREHVRHFEDHLTETSHAIAIQGVTHDVRVTLSSMTGEGAAMRLNPAIDDTNTDDNHAELLDPLTDASKLPAAEDEHGVPAPNALPISLAPIAEKDADDSEDQDDGIAKSQCKICLDELAPEATIVINCGCAYCGTCLNSHIMHALSSRVHFPARCCTVEGIDIGDVESYLTLDVLLRWSEVESEYRERMPMYCQNKECSAHIPEGRLEGEAKFIDCNFCHTDTCRECKQWRSAHGGDETDICPEDIVSKEDRELANTEKWKQCPGCKNLVERSDGCNNMLCECSTEFCYDCGVEFSPDHQCGCDTIPDPDGYHYRIGEMPVDIPNPVNPRERLDDDQFAETLGNALFRADREGQGRFTNADDAGTWLWQQEEELVWEPLSADDLDLAFQAYERIREVHNERANDPSGGWGVAVWQEEEATVGREAADLGHDERMVDTPSTGEQSVREMEVTQAALWQGYNDDGDSEGDVDALIESSQSASGHW